jgi:hypothetical protein
MSDDFAPPLSAGAVTERVQQYLSQTKPWVRLISVLIFIGSAFMVIGALGMFALIAVGTATAGSTQALGGASAWAVAALMYLVMAGLYIAPGIFLSRYASAIGRLIHDRSTATLENALMHQRSFWRYIGIMTLVMFGLMVLLIVIVMIAMITNRPAVIYTAVSK